MEMQVFFSLVGAAIGAGTIAVTVVLWIGNKFDKHEAISNQRHIENLERFGGIDLKLLRLELRNDRKDGGE